MPSHVRTTIRYDGPALANHEMDVKDLAPALLALADIIQAANKKFNGDAASMRVLVNADVEQKCFQIDLSLVQSVFDYAKGLLGTETVKSAEEIGKAVGIIASSAVGLFRVVKFFTTKSQSGGTSFNVSDTGGSTVIVINGDGNSLTIPRDVFDLAADPSISEKTKAVVQPLARQGYETLSFIDHDTIVETVSAAEADEMLSASPIVLAPRPIPSRSLVHGPVRIKSAQYEGAAKWTVMWAGRGIEVAMPPDWVQQFQKNEIDAPPGTILDVEMELIVPVDATGTAAGTPSYTVLKINRVTLPEKPPKQISLFEDQSSKSNDS